MTAIAYKVVIFDVCLIVFQAVSRDPPVVFTTPYLMIF